MSSRPPRKVTRAEEAYVRDMARRSAFEKVDRGEARILPPAEIPEPLKRLAARQRSEFHIRLPTAARRQLLSLSRSEGVSPEELARRWVEQGLKRAAG